MKNKTALCAGAGGFICSHFVSKLKKEGYWVRGVDLKYPEFSTTDCDEFIIGDLRDPKVVKDAMSDIQFDLVIQMAADMGGWLHVFSGENDFEIVHNSALINLNVANMCAETKVGHVFLSSSACAYPEEKQEVLIGGLKESDCFPANPDSPYGWEKIYAEIMYETLQRNHGIPISIARYHNIFGNRGTFDGGRQKSPADICRQAAQAKDGGYVTLNNDGTGIRSYLFIDECIEGTWRLINSGYSKPVNIGSDEAVTINQLAEMVIKISGKDLSIRYIPSTAMGVKQRNSDNTLVKEVLGWRPTAPLYEGLEKTYKWINETIHKNTK